ncbi:phosphotransferase family protein [Pelagerythrobacter rhizovicinus]|uniref:Phosphotransferase family protein n=1 Tax=Pelagerythrobacter rhizovicinus TaxID=2268576 RepID=A0A4V1QW40_9SPHN|nr:phosphotransferase family protein [Pelagerythrobacter rhizovicinus]
MPSQPAASPSALPRAGDIDRQAASRLEQWMARHIGDHEGPVAIERFPGGQSNPTFRLRSSRRDYVLRRKPPGALLHSAHAIEREYTVMAALGPQGFPVPRTYGLCEDESVIGSAFFLMELVEGRILWDPKLPEEDPAERRAIYDAQVDALVALHGFDPAAIGLGAFGKPGSYFARQIGRWTKQYRASEAPHDEYMEKLIAWLAETVPPVTSSRIVHGDYRIDNMVLKHDRPEIAALLDWELCTLGDPIADLTYFLMMWRMPPHERIAMDTVDFATSGIPTMEDALDRYLTSSGRVLDRPIDWYIAFNLFRLAAILQGVAGRAVRGQANNERALSAQSRVAPLARAGWENARRAGAPA